MVEPAVAQTLTGPVATFSSPILCGIQQPSIRQVVLRPYARRLAIDETVVAAKSNAMAPPLLTLKDVHLTFGGTPLLEGAELTVAPGERICLVGRNGSGKSTLLKIAAGMIQPDTGERFAHPGATVQYLPQEADFAGFDNSARLRRSWPRSNRRSVSGAGPARRTWHDRRRGPRAVVRRRSPPRRLSPRFGLKARRAASR